MPTIPNFEQARGVLPEAPAATDINPSQFGKDTAALQEVGGELANIGSKLLQVRKQAMESDAIAEAQSRSIIKMNELEEKARIGFQEQVLSEGSITSPHGSMADSVRGEFSKFVDEQVKLMPTGDAQAAYRNRMQDAIAQNYVSNLNWENKARVVSYSNNLAKRTNVAKQNIYGKRTVNNLSMELKALDSDIKSKIGVLFDEGTANKALADEGKEYVRAFFNGLADSPNKGDIEYGRALLSRFKQEMPDAAKFIDDKDIASFKNKLDEGEREHRMQENIDRQIEARAQEERQKAVQNQVLTQIYEGKASIRSILNTDLDPSKKQQMINVLEARAKEPEFPDPRNLRDVVGRMALDEDDPNFIGSESQVLDLYVNGKLTWDQKQKAIGELSKRNSVSGQVELEQRKLIFKRAEEVLVKDSPFGQDEESIKNHAKFVSFALNELEQAKDDPKLMKELLDPNSPKSLLAKVSQFKPTPNQLMRQKAERIKVQALAKQGVTKIEQPKGRIRMLDPSGKPGFVREDQVDAAKAKGFKLAPVPEKQGK